MDRRAFLALGLLAAPLAGEGQPADKAHRIGVLTDVSAPGTARPVAFPALERRLSQLGHVIGKNLHLEFRSAEGRGDRLGALAAELVSLSPDLIISSAGPEGALALKRATGTIPVVFAAVEWDPVRVGIAASLARPGSNFTGMALLGSEIAVKRVEQLREALPRMTRVAVLWHRSRGAEQFRTIVEAGRSMKLRVISLELGDLPHDLDGAFRAAARERADAIVVLGSPAFRLVHARLAELALRHRLPSIFAAPRYVRAGGLMAFGPDIDDMWRRLADYADRVLKGARPADTPIEQPTKFELVINLKTAKALGLTIPPALLARADQVIE